MLKEKIIKNKILVVGDFMLDSYWLGNVSRISPEAPVPVFQMHSNRSVVGGAANVAANLMAAGQKALAASVIGDDVAGDKLCHLLCGIGCDCSLLIKSNRRKTTVKTRLLAQNNQQLLRVDEEEVLWLDESEEIALLSGISKEMKSVRAVILSDYLKGVLMESVCRKVVEMAKTNNVPVYCDIKDIHIEKYKGATLLKPNRKELELITGMPVKTEGEIKKACQELCGRGSSRYVLATLGAQGMALYTRENDQIEFIHSETREVYDVSGAGDTVISYLVACLLSGHAINEAASYANRAAGIKVGKVGTATVSIDEVEADLGREALLPVLGEKKRESKAVALPDLCRDLHNLAYKKIVFTNGCFDILHAGHVMYLQKAAEYGDVLIVGVNGDESVKRIKGSLRPVNSISDRVAVLSGLECVSYIVVFEDDTPEVLIQSIMPDILVKGTDYDGKFIAGAEFVKKHGGEVVLIPMLEGRSTTNIIKNVRGDGSI